MMTYPYPIYDFLTIHVSTPTKIQMPDTLSPPRLLRCLAAIFYDGLLLLSVLFFAGVLAYPITHGHANFLYTLYLFGVSFLYFAWPWLHGGQTVGLLCWRLRLQTVTGEPLTWRQAFLRFTIAILSCLIFGMGFFWAIFDSQHRTWHDWVSGTQLVYIPKNPNKD